MITLYNTTASTSAADYSKNNPWERGIRPKNTLGNGGKNPSGMMVDLFPMADGKRPATYGSYTKLETYLTDRVALLLNARERALFGSDIGKFHTQVSLVLVAVSFMFLL